MVNFTRTTVQKQGTLQEEGFNYNVNVTIEDSVLTRLGVEIIKRMKDLQDQHVGYVSQEQGRQVAEIASGEDIIPHLIKFQEILNEVLGVEKMEE